MKRKFIYIILITLAILSIFEKPKEVEYEENGQMSKLEIEYVAGRLLTRYNNQ